MYESMDELIGQPQNRQDAEHQVAGVHRSLFEDLVFPRGIEIPVEPVENGDEQEAGDGQECDKCVHDRLTMARL